MFPFDEICNSWTPGEPTMDRGEAFMLRITQDRLICFYELTNAPKLPLDLVASPAVNLVACQSNTVASFEAIVGHAPVEGTILYRLNPAEYRGNWLKAPDFWIYTFSNGAWSPTVPMAEIGEGVVIEQPGVFVDQPRALKPHVVNGKFIFDLETVYGTPITVEYSDQPSGGGWQVLTSMVGDGFRKTISDQTALTNVGQRYYWIRVN